MIRLCPIRTPIGLRNCLVYSGPDKDYVLCHVVCTWDPLEEGTCPDGAMRSDDGRIECTACALVPAQYSPREKLHVIQKEANDIMDRFSLHEENHVKIGWKLGENVTKFLSYLTEDERKFIEEACK